ncbi:cation:proton antiporter [Microvirga sp. TS319]|uniref:cation:proton antiporter n=1 Tax=Microvirga sp. TS319 TaxID=3241165 RepID=UPI003519FAB5
MAHQVQLFGFLPLGFIILSVVWLPVFLRKFPLSMPMLAVAFGYAFFFSMPAGRFFATYSKTVEVLLEFVLVIAVMGAGLKIDRPFSLTTWSSTWRTLGLGMPLSIAAIAVCGLWLLDLSPAAAILLAGILAPTDPVLASNVQVGPPGTGEEGEVRFALTSEAGLNDGLAYPFVTLGLILRESTGDLGSFERWFLFDDLWKIGAAVGLGFAIGRAVTWINQHLPERFRLSQSNNGLAAVGVALLVYGAAEIIWCYGFVAVFAAASTIRNTTKNLSYTRDVHSSAEQIEQLVSILILTLFGGALAEGLISSLSASEIVFALLVLLLLRPLSMLAAFAGSGRPMPVRLAIGFFGIRGLGSLYYTAYAINRGHAADPERLWRLTGFIVLLSVLVYGISAGPVMNLLDRLRKRHGE